jgi:hypothetical protein
VEYGLRGPWAESAANGGENSGFRQNSRFRRPCGGRNACQIKAMSEAASADGTAEKIALTADFDAAAGFDQ